MSEFPPSGASGTEAKVPAFADALQRAKQIASKIRPGASAAGPATSAGIKRPCEDSVGGPESKKSAAINDPFGAQLAARQQNNAMEGDDQHASELMMVPDSMVGLIIGRGGESIMRLQNETGCKIQMAPAQPGVSDRQCTLTGSPVNISQAKSQIMSIIANEGNGPSRGPPSGHMGGGGSSFEMLVPGEKVGLIIGKGGENIKMMQQQSGARIVVIQDSNEHASEKPVQITGTHDAINKAKDLLHEILNREDERDMGFGGRGRGRGGFRGGMGGRGGFMGGRGGPRGGGRGGFSGNWGGGNEFGGGEQTAYVAVPSNKCGLVIGKGGETIKSINDLSGAHCEVERNSAPDAREKNFILRGSPEQIDKARSMILEKVGMQPGGGPGGYGGPGGGYGGPGGGYGGGPPQSNGASWGGQFQQPAAGVDVDPHTGQPDYSKQWAEYFRNQEAAAAAQQQTRPQPAAAAAGGTADYSLQWIAYYEANNMHKEAQAVRDQLNMKAGANPVTGGGQGYPGAPAQPAAAEIGGFYGGRPQAAVPGAPASSFPGYYGVQRSS